MSNEQRPLAPGHNEGPKLPVAFIGSAFLALLVIGVVGAAWFTQLRKNRVDPLPPVLGTVSALTFTDANGEPFSISELDGRIWVADSIFTRCGGMCPVMSTRMRQLQKWLEENEHGGVKLVTFTVDPEHDTPEVLKQYAENFKADPDRWYFLTGPRELIYKYLMDDFMLGVEENDGVPEAEMFIHSDKFVLLDRNRNIRGYFSGLEETDMEKLRRAITSLAYETETPEPQGLATVDDLTTATAGQQETE